MTASSGVSTPHLRCLQQVTRGGGGHLELLEMLQSIPGYCGSEKWLKLCFTHAVRHDHLQQSSRTRSPATILARRSGQAD
eukprot:1748450-Amphidinium_carterae.1